MRDKDPGGVQDVIQLRDPGSQREEGEEEVSTGVLMGSES